MNQFYLGLLRGVGYPVLFAALTALCAAIPGVQGLPSWLPAGLLTMIVAGFEHYLADYLGYNIPSVPGVSA